MTKKIPDFVKALKGAGLNDTEIANLETEGIDSETRLNVVLEQAQKQPDPVVALKASLSCNTAVASLLLKEFGTATQVTAAPTTAQPVAPAEPASASATGGFEQLLKRLIPPQTLMEALILLADDPTEERSQQFWLQFAGPDATLLAESAPGVIDLETSKAGVTIFNESNASPSEYNGKPLYTLAQFLKKVVIVCVLTGDRLVQGKGLKTGVSYRLLGLTTDNLETAKTLPGVQLLAFAASERLIQTGDATSAKADISALGILIRGLDTMTAVKDAVDGTKWAEVVHGIELDSRAGGSKMTAALTRLVGTVAPNRQGTRPTPSNPLGTFVEGLTGGTSKCDPLDTTGRGPAGNVW